MNFKNFSYRVDTNFDKWNSLLPKFQNSNIYQTAAFNKYSVGGENLEIFYLEHDGDIVSAAIVRIKLIPMLKRGIAYIRWAPLISKKYILEHNVIFEKTIKQLKKEYVEKRSLALRLMLNYSKDVHQSIIDILKRNNFINYSNSSESIILDLDKSLDDTRAGFRKKWRYSLKQSEKKGLDISVSDSNDSFEEFINIYNQMHSRKNFKEYVSVDNFRKINQKLPNEQKCKVFTCYKESEPLASMVISAMGDTGIYLLGGSTTEGLKHSASYLLQWTVIKWLKENNIKYYDLGGIDKKTNPGVYTFKSGMGGEEITYLGGFECVNDFISKSIVKALQFLK